MENEEKIIKLLVEILGELRTLNAYISKGKTDAESIQKKQMDESERMMGVLKQCMPAGMAEKIFGGTNNG